MDSSTSARTGDRADTAGPTTELSSTWGSLENDVITPAELDALSGDCKTRTAYHKAAATRADRRRADHVLDAARDLADALAVARGRDTPEVEFTRFEVTQIRGGATSVQQS